MRQLLFMDNIAKENINKDLDRLLAKMKRLKLNQLRFKVLKVKRDLNNGVITITEAETKYKQYKEFVNKYENGGDNNE